MGEHTATTTITIHRQQDNYNPLSSRPDGLTKGAGVSETGL